MQVAEYNPKQVRDQQDVDASGLTAGSTLIWNGSFFETRPTNFSDISGTLSIDQFPPGTVVSIDSIDADALYFFDNTLFAPRLISAADARTFLGITGGSGDVVGPSSSIDAELVLFDSTTGKLIKRATGSGLVKSTSGVYSTVTDNSSNWDTAFTERRQWDGGATNLVAATGRTSLGLVIGTNVQSWDADLDALAALSGTNNIYYRSAANTWSSVTIGSNLTFSGGTLSATAGGSGTVTNTGGNLTANSVVLGAGTVDTKVVAGITSDGTSKLTLGVAGTSVGAVAFKNATSGTITLQPVTGALTTVTLSLPAEAGTLATQTWTTTVGVPAIVTGTGFWHSTSGSLEGAAIAQTGTGSVVLADSPSHTTLVTLTRTALGATPNDGFIIQNTTAAANNAQQVSPQIRLNGRGWDSTNTVSKAVDAHIYLKPVQGAGNPTAQLIFETAINSGAFGNPMTFDSSGNLTIAGLTASALIATDSNKTLTNVTIGTGLSYSGGTLSATGGSADNLGLTPTAVKTSAYTAAAGDFVPVDTTSGNVTITFPTAPADKSVLAIKHVIQGGSNVVNLALGGSDVFNKSGGPTTGSIALVNQAIVVQYKATGAIWYVVSDDLPLGALDGRYQPLNSNLTTIASLTATTDNFIVSSASAWASRTPSQVRTTLGLVIGTNVQAWDADLDTWAGITPATGVGTFLATPSSANLRATLTDENGTGAALFDSSTSATFITPILGTPTSGDLRNCSAATDSIAGVISAADHTTLTNLSVVSASGVAPAFVGIGLPVVANKTGVDFKTNAVTDIFTVPASRTFVCTGAVIIPTSITGAAAVAIVWKIIESGGSLAISSGNASPSASPSLIKAWGQAGANAAGGGSPVAICTTGNKVQFSITTAWTTTTTVTGTVFVFGFYST